MPAFKPSYIETHKKGLLRKKSQKAYKELRSCDLCPRHCSVNRLAGETGICRTGENSIVSSYNAHFGEEAPLVGSKGSGTIFFTHCNLLCNFCQNYEISHLGDGQEVSDRELADIMLYLQDSGCHNINFVTPTHVVPQILSAVEIAASEGLSVPLVYNSGGYEKVESLKLLEGVFDIYLPDFKFWNSGIAQITCNAHDYPEAARNALIEMHRQVGDLVCDSSGTAERGLLIRHLVLPEGFAGTREIMRFIVEKISKNSFVNIMSQYRPCGNAHEVEALSSRLTYQDYTEAFQAAKDEGITRFHGVVKSLHLLCYSG